MLFFGVVGGGVYGWKEYQRKKRYGGFGSGNFGGGMGMGAGGGSGMLGMGGAGRFGGAYASEKRF